MLHPVVAAIEQWHWGNDPVGVARAASDLRLIDPDHWLLQELAQKLATLLSKGEHGSGAPDTPNANATRKRRV